MHAEHPRPAAMTARRALLFCAGTEIRIRVEEELLRRRFHEALERYRRRVKAYIPLVR